MNPDPHILTYTGRVFHICRDDDTSEIDIVDIARGLAAEPRYNGHTVTPYNVADHSVRVAQLVVRVEPRLGRLALLHDATEAYIKDMPKPVKQLLPDYEELEARIDARIRKRFSLPDDPDGLVKFADRTMLAHEQRWLRNPKPKQHEYQEVARQQEAERGNAPLLNQEFTPPCRSYEASYDAFILAWDLLSSGGDLHQNSDWRTT